MKSLIIIATASLGLLTTSCMENKSENKATELQAIFPKGELGPAIPPKFWNSERQKAKETRQFFNLLKLDQIYLSAT